MKGIEHAAVLQNKVEINGTCSDRFAPFVPNRWISGPYEQHRSGNIVRAVYQALNAAS